MGHEAQAAGGRKAAARGKTIAGTRGRKSNLELQHNALNRMSLIERETGLTPAQLDEFHRAQRERVLRRYGT